MVSTCSQTCANSHFLTKRRSSDSTVQTTTLSAAVDFALLSTQRLQGASRTVPFLLVVSVADNLLYTISWQKVT